MEEFTGLDRFDGTGSLQQIYDRFRGDVTVWMCDNCAALHLDTGEAQEAEDSAQAKSERDGF